MAKLYYGNGNCSITGSDIRGVEIRYSGAIKIEDKTSDAFVVMNHSNKILIFPIGEGTLNELFDYIGEFKILSIIVADNNAERIYATIHKVMDYAELLETNAEDMTTKSEDLSATYVSDKKVSKTSINRQNLNNQHTSGSGSLYETHLYLEDGTLYIGDYHIHLADNGAMTGKVHTPESQALYFKNGKPTKNSKLIPYSVIEKKKNIKKMELKSKRLNKFRKKY